MVPTINVCRFCKQDSTQGTLHKYGVRHYACAACGFAHFGVSFFDRLPVHEVRRLPFVRVAAALGDKAIPILNDYVARRDRDDRYTIAEAIERAAPRDSIPSAYPSQRRFDK